MYFLFLSISLSPSPPHCHSNSPYVGQSMCIDIFSVYRSPESRIGDHPRNRLSHFYVLQKWSGQVLSSTSLSFHWVSTLQPPSHRQWRGRVKNSLNQLQHSADGMSHWIGEKRGTSFLYEWCIISLQVWGWSTDVGRLALRSGQPAVIGISSQWS